MLSDLYPKSKLIGIDVSSKMILKTGNWYTVPPNATFLNIDALNFSHSTKFDYAFSIATLYYIHPMELLKPKICEWLNPHGIFISGTDFWKENPRCLSWPGTLQLDMDLRSQEEWKKLFEEGYGLMDVTQEILRYEVLGDEDAGTLFTIGTVK